MPRTRTRPKSITIGIFGLGETPPQNITALLDDHLGDAEATFILPATSEHFTKTVDAIATYCADTDTAYEVITDDSSAKARSLKLLIKDATANSKATDVGTAIVNRLREADDGRLIVLWDETLGEDDGGAYDAIEYAEENKIKVFDLCNGLEPIDFGDGGDDEDEKEPEPEEKPASRRGRKLAAVKDEPDDDDDDQDDDEDAPPATAEQYEGLPPFAQAEQMGVRALRNMARERELAPHRAIGSMDKDGVLALLYPPKGAHHQTTLEEQISSAEHAVNGASRAVAGALTFEAFIDALAASVASKVIAEVKELVDA